MAGTSACVAVEACVMPAMACEDRVDAFGRLQSLLRHSEYCLMALSRPRGLVVLPIRRREGKESAPPGFHTPVGGLKASPEHD